MNLRQIIYYKIIIGPNMMPKLKKILFFKTLIPLFQVVYVKQLSAIKANVEVVGLLRQGLLSNLCYAFRLMDRMDISGFLLKNSLIVHVMGATVEPIKLVWNIIRKMGSVMKLNTHTLLKMVPVNRVSASILDLLSNQLVAPLIK